MDNQNIEQDRGLKKKLAIGAGMIALITGTVIVGGIAYKTHKKRKMKKINIYGNTRDIECDTLVDEYGNELEGQIFDHNEICENEQQVLSRAIQNGQLTNYQNNNQYDQLTNNHQNNNQYAQYDQYPEHYNQYPEYNNQYFQYNETNNNQSSFYSYPQYYNDVNNNY